ncbi:MAG: hypothetical protein ABI809_12540 [Caldimonas sp.]
MAFARTVAAETLDGLAENDPAARRSRRDLRRIHRAMRTRSIVVGALRAFTVPSRAPLRVLELGAGDGSLMLGVARRLGRSWPAVELTLLDRQALVEPATLEAYAALGWRASAQVADVLDWVAAPSVAAPHGDAAPHWDLIVANLFLHHFEGAQLAALIGAIAARGDRFVACEPRRSALALGGSGLVGALGANAVTREDAVLSVRAGFRDAELAALWPGADEWRIHEGAAGLFSHCFRAERREAEGAARVVGG